MTIQIKNRFSGAVLFETEAETLGEAVKKALSARANLADANLAGADLADANLAGANLAGANLAGAYLAGANLADAYLAGADLAGADLAGANLARADLADANLADANLAGADLADANLAGANLAGANLAGAYLAGANLADAYLADADLADAYLADADLADAYLAPADLARARRAPASLADHKDPETPYARNVTASASTHEERAKKFRERYPNVPVVENLDSKILEAISSGGGTLDMGNWHSCETTHCRAGWAIHLAGAAGYKLESDMGDDPQRAGRAIYRASTGRVPHFFATNEQALADIKRCAAEEADQTPDGGAG